MKETPILFSAPMVRAILAGTKTQTRRLVRIDDAPISKADFDGCKRQRGIPTNAQNVRMMVGYVKCDAPPESYTVSSRVDCPYGWIEDRLWVKETHRFAGGDSAKSTEVCKGRDGVRYRADPHEEGIDQWRPSIFMHRWASRITLENTRIRVERLNDISEADALAEGVQRGWFDDQGETPGRYLYFTDANGPLHGDDTAVEAYRRLWESINGAGSWELNQWVWAISFKRI